MIMRTESDVFRLLCEVVAEQPSRVYAAPEAIDGVESCAYTITVGDTIAPSCIVGHVLDRDGVPLKTLREWNTETADTFVNNISGTGAWDCDADALQALSEAQQLQDRGVLTWDEVLTVLIYTRRNDLTLETFSLAREQGICAKALKGYRPPAPKVIEPVATLVHA